MRPAMRLNDLLELPNGHSLSAEDVQGLNEALSAAELKDIPLEKRSLVADYIEVAFLHGTVAPELKDALNKLLEQLKAAS